MKKTLRKIDMGEGKLFVTVILDDEPYDDDVKYIEFRRKVFMDEFVATPSLWDCESKRFEKLEMYHNGTNWVIKLTATTG